MGADREWIFGQLRQTLVALSLPGPDALATKPPRSAKADELALDYDHFLAAALENFGAEFTGDQRAELEALNSLLGEMSGPGEATLWTESAVTEHPKWAVVRKRAHEARRLLGWDARDAAG